MKKTICLLSLIPIAFGIGVIGSIGIQKEEKLTSFRRRRISLRLKRIFKATERKNDTKS